MLDFMRRHAEGWGIKILLGFISLSFVLFFGYSAYTGRQLGGQAAAEVGSELIPAQQYQESYQAALSRLQGQFEDGVPDNIAKFLRSNVLQQLIQQKILVQHARTLGFQIADSELAQMIRKQEQFYRDGMFDLAYYKENFLPFYKQRYGVDFEDLLREDLLLDLYDTFRRVGPLQSIEEQRWHNDLNRSTWTFEVIEVPQAKPEATDALQEQLLASIERWQKGAIPNKDLEKLGATLKDKVAFSFAERQKLLGRSLPDEYVRPIFSIKEKGTVYPDPILLGSRWYLLKLYDYEVKEEVPESPEAFDRLNNEFFTVWLDDFRRKLDIKTNVNL